MITMSGSKRRAISIASATDAGLGDDLEPLAPVEHRDEALADDLVVVDDEQAEWSCRCVAGHQASCSLVPSGRPWVRVARYVDRDDDTGTRARRALDRERAAVAGRPAGHVGQPLVGRAAATAPGSKPVPLSLISRRTAGPSIRRAIEARLAWAWRATFESASRVMWKTAARACAGIAAAAVGSIAVSTSTIELSRTSSARASQRADQIVVVEQLRAEAHDEVADVADRHVEGVDRSVDAGPRLVAILVHELGQVLERQADRVDALDDPVVEVLGDPLALVDDGQALDLFVEPGVLDGDAGVQREHLDERLIVLGELGRADLVGQVEVAHRDAGHDDRHAQERAHRRVMGREARAVRVRRDLGDPERASPRG